MLICRPVLQNWMKIVGYQIFLRITRFVILVIRPDYQKFGLRSTPDVCMYVCMYKLYFPTVKTWLQKVISPRVVWLIKVSNVKRRQRRLILELFSIPTRWRIHSTLVPTRVCTWWRTWCPSCSASYGLTSRHSKTVENPSRLASHPRSPWLPRWASLTSYSSSFPSVRVTPVIRRSVVRLLFVSIAPVVGPFSPHLLFLRLSWQSFAVVVLVFCNLLVFLCLKSFQ